jgi:hypothetical protein
MQKQQYGINLPSTYAGLVPLGQNGPALNTRNFNPFRDVSSLVTPDGIAAGLNPLVNVGARKVFGVPSVPTNAKRMTPWGSLQPDVNVGDELQNTMSGLPGAQLVGALTGGTGKTAPQGVGNFLGAHTYQPIEVQKIIDRATKSQAELDKLQAKANGQTVTKRKASAGLG